MAELPISDSMWHGCAGRPSPGFPPRIGVRGMLLIAGITMALRRPHKPHKRMKIGNAS